MSIAQVLSCDFTGLVGFAAIFSTSLLSQMAKAMTAMKAKAAAPAKAATMKAVKAKAAAPCQSRSYEGDGG